MQSGAAAPRAAPTAHRASPAATSSWAPTRAEGFAADGEGPARRVRVGAFGIAPTTVTNREFTDFVRATRYITEAEQAGSSFVFYLQVPAAGAQRSRQSSRGLPWWLPVDDACWQRPEGPGSHVRDRLDHPGGARLLERRAGLLRLGRRCACRPKRSGNTRRAAASTASAIPGATMLEADGTPRCNIWRGAFPDAPAPGWSPGTVAAARVEPNGFGLYNMAAATCGSGARTGSPPTTTADRGARSALRAADRARSMRGGSFLCHDSYCNRYRVAARGANTPDSAASNLGFRVVR